VPPRQGRFNNACGDVRCTQSPNEMERDNAAWRKRIIFPYFVSWYLSAAGFRFHKAYTFEIAQSRAWHGEPLTFYEQLPALLTFSAFCVEDAFFIGALAVLCLAFEQLTRCRALLVSISYVLSLVCILFGCAEHAYFMATGIINFPSVFTMLNLSK